MNVLKNKILQLRKDNSMSWELWAELSGKTVETLKKQMTDDANPTLATLISVLAPLHASLEILTEQERSDLAQIEVLRDRVSAMEKLLTDARADREKLDGQITALSISNESLSKQNEQLQKMIEKLEITLDKKEQSIERKEEVIARKDTVIAELLRKGGVIG